MRLLRGPALLAMLLGIVACPAPTGSGSGDDDDAVATNDDDANDDDAIADDDDAIGNDDDIANDDDVANDDDTASVTCLGSVYGPDVPNIDPDDPIYEDDQYSQEQVTEMFEEAAAANNTAYQAYAISLQYPDVVECAFCACGCRTSDEHLSAVDCFKDMHGFT